jgi:hypothetical protein
MPTFGRKPKTGDADASVLTSFPIAVLRKDLTATIVDQTGPPVLHVILISQHLRLSSRQEAGIATSRGRLRASVGRQCGSGYCHYR